MNKLIILLLMPLTAFAQRYGDGGSIAPSGNPVPSYVNYIGAKGTTNLLAPLLVDASGNLKVSGSFSLSGGSVDQGTPNSLANAWPVKVTDGTNYLGMTAAHEALVDITQPLPAGTNILGSIINVSGTVSLPTGASTSAAQTTGNSSLSSIDGKIPSNLTVSSTRLLVDASGTIQPVSGPLTDTQLRASAVPVSGSGNFTVTQGTGTNLHVVSDSTSTTAVTQATASNLNATVVQATGSNLHVAVDSAPTTAVSQSGTWNITNVSGTVSLPTGASTEASLAKLTQTQGSTTSGQSGPLVLGAVTTAAPSYTTAQSSPISLTTAGALRVDASASTQPVSGTVTANIGTSGSLALDASVKLVQGTVAAGTAASNSTLIGGVFNTSLPSLTTGQQVAVQLDTKGRQYVVQNNTAGNSPGSGTVSTVTTLTAPSNTIGFVLMNLDTSTANLRWRIGATATTSSGQQLQPGRDTGYVPCSANISLVSESGTQNYDVQWVLSQ